MTLLFTIGPDVARNFCSAIQSFGMTFPAIWIFLSKIKIEKNYLLITGAGGAIGICLAPVIVFQFITALVIVQPGILLMVFSLGIFLT